MTGWLAWLAGGSFWRVVWLCMLLIISEQRKIEEVRQDGSYEEEGSRRSQKEQVGLSESITMIHDVCINKEFCLIIGKLGNQIAYKSYRSAQLARTT